MYLPLRTLGVGGFEDALANLRAKVDAAYGARTGGVPASAGGPAMPPMSQGELSTAMTESWLLDNRGKSKRAQAIKLVQDHARFRGTQLDRARFVEYVSRAERGLENLQY